MNTQRRKTTGRRVAALGALSAAGLVAAGADQAKAEIIVTHVGIDINVSQNPTGGAWELPGGSTFAFFRSWFYHDTYTSNNILLFGKNFAVLGSPYPGPASSQIDYIRPVDEGQTFPDLEPVEFAFAFLNIVSPGGVVAGPGEFTDKYYAFVFSPDGGTTTWYGWMLGSFTNVSYENLTYHFDSFAYDNTGAVIPMGTLNAVPEPASAAMALLGGALVAGAAGLRRWKKSRAEAAV